MKIIQALLDYYGKTRTVGHTTAMLNGVRDAPCIVLAVNLNHAQLLQKQIPAESKTESLLDVVKRGALLGEQMPLLIDNWTMVTICQDVLDELGKKDREILELKIRIGKMKQLAVEMGNI